MLRKLFRNKVRSPLFDYVAKMTPEIVAQICEQNEDSKNFSGLIAGNLIISCANAFVVGDYPRLKKMFGPSAKDVVAFEALAFSAFAIDHYYFADHVDEDWELDEDPHGIAAQKAFSQGFSFCCIIVEREMGVDHSSVFQDRVMEYAHAHIRGGMKDVTEVLRGILQTVGNANTPQRSYGRFDLSFENTINAMATIQAYSASYPPTLAQSLHDLAKHYGFFGRL